jgi:hypothetical protein
VSSTFDSAKVQYHQLFLRYPIVALMVEQKHKDKLDEYIQNELEELEMM